MQVFIKEMHSDHFEIQNTKENTEEDEQVFQELKVHDETAQQSQEPSANCTDMIPVRLNDYYVVISPTKAASQFKSKQEWEILLRENLHKRLNCMSVVAINSIILLEDLSMRNFLWESVTKQEKTQNWEKQIYETNEKVTKQIRINIERMYKKLHSVSTTELNLKVIIQEIIFDFQATQPYLGQLKGLQYICFSVLKVRPSQSIAISRKAFLYLMNIVGLKQIHYAGSPLYFSELAILLEQLKQQAEQLYKRLESNKADWSKLFVAYYRTMLLIKVQNPYLISKIVDLILVYGISIIRIFLVRILCAKEKEFMLMQNVDKLMSIIATDLVVIQLQNFQQSNEQNKQQIKEQEKNIINKKIRKLIIGIE